jgi:hypothetical protein
LRQELELPIDPSTAFVSYSREDLEFVRRLATDLKAKGAKVWMDKLDIRPGQRWEVEVENALNDCSRMLAILSPASVASKNVLAEAAYAIDEGKEVIPVLYCECKIPFRLRPFQYADFRTDYGVGMVELLASLNGEQDSATREAPLAVVPVSSPSKSEEEQKLRELQRRADEGDTSAMIELGNAFYDGQLVRADRSQAFDWFSKAAEAGDAMGMFRVGLLFNAGEGVEQDQMEAARWYRKAAEAGHADGMFTLAYSYELGVGVELDYEKARSWYLESARHGRVDADAALQRISAKEAAEKRKRAQERERKAAEKKRSRRS